MRKNTRQYARPEYLEGGTILNTATSAASGFATAGPIGAVAMGGMALTTGLLQEEAAKKANKEKKEQEEALLAQQETDRSSAIYGNYNSIGNQVGSFYGEMGGEIKATDGGNLAKITEGVHEVQGKTHEEGGVGFALPDGTTGEVEDEEIILDNNEVISEALGYAEQAKTILERIERLENLKKQKQ